MLLGPGEVRVQHAMGSYRFLPPAMKTHRREGAEFAG
jgi:hypothetical protein